MASAEHKAIFEARLRELFGDIEVRPQPKWISVATWSTIGSLSVVWLGAGVVVLRTLLSFH